GNQKNNVVSTLEMNTIFNIWNILTPQTKLIQTIDEAEEFAQKNKYPVVLKISSPEILHKTELGAVIPGIDNDQLLHGSFAKLQSTIANLEEDIKKTCSIIIQKHIKGKEIIIGIKKDKSFGNVLMIGAGGTLAELISDRNLLIHPFTQSDIERKVLESKMYKLLSGYRGDKPYAIGSLYDFIKKFIVLTESIPAFSEIEINPVMVTYENSYAVDGRAILANKIKEPENKSQVSEILNKLKEFSDS
ncbi:MAG TPA: acetate--CoA ligase family protein, partial [Candidatus Nitrosocosmicus sp.]|nr:acetate--CoA ligase family protein [Candidatus Nitrosocosmicus sp.]